MYNHKRKNTNIFDEIFMDIYSKLECNIIYVFLCGGDCSNIEENHQIRNAIKELLIEKSKNKIQVLYPEELFFDSASKNISKYFRKKDLLELETILAHNSNAVCIICESMGSATELGAFTNYRSIEKNELLDKLIAVTFSKYEKYKPSFISEGPIKRIVNRDKAKWKLYKYEDGFDKNNISENQEYLSQELIEEIYKICKKNDKKSYNKIFLQPNEPLKNFIGLAYFILIYLFFYNEVKSSDLKLILKDRFEQLQIRNLDSFDFYYRIAINFLVDNQNFIEKMNSKYSLTSKGLFYIKGLLSEIESINQKDVDYIRIRTMHNNLYNKKKKGDYIS